MGFGGKSVALQIMHESLRSVRKNDKRDLEKNRRKNWSEKYFPNKYIFETKKSIFFYEKVYENWKFWNFEKKIEKI